MALLGPPTTRDLIPDLLEANLRKAFLEPYSKIPALYERLYAVDTSNKKIERDAVVAGLGTYQRKDEGEAPVYDSGQEAWAQQYTHKGYALGMQITREAMQDDLHGVIRWMSQMGGGLAQVAKYTKERDALDLFNTLATSGTVYTAGGTAYSLLSTAHFRVDGGTWSNTPTSKMDLSIEALEFLVSDWMINQVNQRGQVLYTQPERLLVGPGDGPLAKRLTKSAQRPQSADNDVNVMKDAFSEVIIHPLLSNDGRWFALAPKEETGLVYFERYRPNVERWPDADNGNMRMVGFYRESHGATKVSGVWGTA